MLLVDIGLDLQNWVKQMQMEMVFVMKMVMYFRRSLFCSNWNSYHQYKNKKITKIKLIFLKALLLKNGIYKAGGSYACFW
jgi:hypothetical protein